MTRASTSSMRSGNVTQASAGSGVERSKAGPPYAALDRDSAGLFDHLSRRLGRSGRDAGGTRSRWLYHHFLQPSLPRSLHEDGYL